MRPIPSRRSIATSISTHRMTLFGAAILFVAFASALTTVERFHSVSVVDPQIQK
ncbi:MAG TPA: hypothetical protein VM099_11355 [Gemmatimonadaceae bacterium]|nr:hypothetical protein [Gemmatimonadaceae bacterium]